MSSLIDAGSLNHLDLNGDIYELVYDLHLDHKPPSCQNLGFVDRATDELKVDLPLSAADLTIRQSMSSLSSGALSSTTGFVCWKSALLLADWILGDPKCPLYPVFKERRPITVLEMGAGVAGVLVSLLGTRTSHYIASDQKPILKLLKENFLANVPTSKFTSSTLSGTSTDCTHSRIDFIEFDWEYLQDGVNNYNEVGPGSFPDLIFATDTIYNEYLIKPFIHGLLAMMGPHTEAVVTMQLRDETITEHLLTELAVTNLSVYTIPSQLLSDGLTSGFITYYIVHS